MYFSILQGILIFALFDVKPKVYFVAYEKVVGRPHPLFHRSRPIKAYTYPTSISSEAARGPSLIEDAEQPEDNIVLPDDEGDVVEEKGEDNNVKRSNVNFCNVN